MDAGWAERVRGGTVSYTEAVAAGLYRPLGQGDVDVAGLVGALDPEPCGSYVYEKLGRTHHVLVYRMAVTEAHDAYPEAAARQRAWLTADEAIDRVDEPGLRGLLRRLGSNGVPICRPPGKARPGARGRCG